MEPDPQVDIRLIRNATLRMLYASKLILIDPFLAPKHSIDSFANISPNPLVDLPCSPEAVIAECEMVIVSHLHPDHFDEVAQELLPKDVPIYCQPGDEDQIASKGFQQVTPVSESVTWEGITLTRTAGKHGTGDWLQRMGNVAGFLLHAEGQPTVYWTGDTIWYEEVAQVIADHYPDIIITHSGGAKFGDDDPIIMDAEQTIAVCRAAPHAKVVAVHFESLDHCATSRSDLRMLADSQGIEPSQLLIPADGETITV